MKSKFMPFAVCWLLFAPSFAQHWEFEQVDSAGWGTAFGQSAGRPVIVLPSGERCVAGQVLVKLSASLRGHVEPVGSGFCRFGVQELDELCRREGVTGINRVVPQPNPGPLVLRSGADLLYLVSFGTTADVTCVMREFEKLTVVDGVWPNAVFDVDGPADEIPDDSLYDQQWYLPRIRAPRAWDIARGDTNVVIGSIASGVMWTHPDIEANLWVNAAEDINGNHRFDPYAPPDGDLDGIDQDGNGYVDDVIGYDFHAGDPNPMNDPGDDLGTMYFGAANAVTGNGIGIAAPPWNARGAALRCGGGGSINMSAAISAMYYCIDNGFWVLSAPWGGTSPYQPLMYACLAAWDAGCMMVASGRGERCYPACYDGVISVGATDRSDELLTGSNYIDIGSPGVDIVVPTSDSAGYAVLNPSVGAACGIAVGVLAWFKSAYPMLTNAEVESLMYDVADSMPGTNLRRIAMVPDTMSAVLERKPFVASRAMAATIVRGVLWQGSAPNLKPQAPSWLRDIGGRKVMLLHPGRNDASGLSPGVYFVRADGARRAAKIVVQR